MPSDDDTCTVHGKPAYWSTCGGYWFCEDAYVDGGTDDAVCEVAAQGEVDEGGEG
jgi:hypothetical protein